MVGFGALSVRDGLAGHSSSAIVLDQVDVTLVGVMGINHGFPIGHPAAVVNMPDALTLGKLLGFSQWSRQPAFSGRRLQTKQVKVLVEMA